HAPAYRVVDGAVALVTKAAENRGARHRLVEHPGDEVDEPLRPRPFAVEARRDELVVGHQVGHRDRLLDPGNDLAVRRRIELRILVEIELLVTRLDAVAHAVTPGPAAGVLRIQRCGRPADETRRLADDVHPPRGVEARGVNVADGRRKPLPIAHQISAPANQASGPRGPRPSGGLKIPAKVEWWAGEVRGSSRGKNSGGPAPLGAAPAGCGEESRGPARDGSSHGNPESLVEAPSV